MTPRRSTNMRARRIDLNDTTSRFRLAREQLAAHSSFDHYCRVREFGGWAVPGATPDPSILRSGDPADGTS